MKNLNEKKAAKMKAVVAGEKETLPLTELEQAQLGLQHEQHEHAKTRLEACRVSLETAVNAIASRYVTPTRKVVAISAKDVTVESFLPGEQDAAAGAGAAAAKG